MDKTAFQDTEVYAGSVCWGCSGDNAHGLQIKSYWDGDESVCNWQPQKYHSAGWPHILNGGIIASLIDCHCCGTALTAASKEREDIDSRYWFATASLHVDYILPTPMNKPLHLRAKIIEMKEKKAVVTCSVYSGDNMTAKGQVVAVRVPAPQTLS